MIEFIAQYTLLRLYVQKKRIIKMMVNVIIKIIYWKVIKSLAGKTKAMTIINKYKYIHVQKWI